jgi:hypothetical protein
VRQVHTHGPDVGNVALEGGEGGAPGIDPALASLEGRSVALGALALKIPATKHQQMTLLILGLYLELEGPLNRMIDDLVK